MSCKVNVRLKMDNEVQIKQMQFFDGESINFKDAFPEIEDITIETEQNGRDIFEWTPKKFIFSSKKGNIVSLITPCFNKSCKGGGFFIRKILSEMYSKKDPQKEDSINCKGHESLGRWNKKGCPNYINLKINIKYKS